MGDSAAALWESELLRARQWLAASRNDKQQQREQLFLRVKAHISFKDHQRSLQSEAAASEEEDDMALDFLGDVDASDMNALLQAEAAKVAAAVPLVETATPVESHMPSARGLMQPLEMPTNLVSPKLKPKKPKPVPMSQLDPKSTTPVTARATLGNDAAVQELLQDLQLDVTHSDVEEGKTEESTPPHLLKNFGGKTKAASNGAQVRAEQSKYMHQVSSKSPQAPHTKKAAPHATDEVGEEMLSWVSGYRDPEVIRRKENMRRKRKHTHRYGVASEEERRQVLMQVKKMTHDSKIDSDSESEDYMSSDYSPAEDEEVPEPDETEVVDLLSDDYLESDEEKRPVKRKRKRLRQAETTQKKKKPRSRKPAITRKLTLQNPTSKITPPPGNVQEVQSSVSSAKSEANHTPATTNSPAIEEDATSTSNQPIELLSSEDETGDSDKDSTPKAVENMSKSSRGADSTISNAAGSEGTKESTILRLKIPKNFKSPQGRFQKEPSPTKVQEKQDPQIEVIKAASITGGNTDSEAAVGDAVGETASELVSSENVALGQNDTLGSPTVNRDANADDADLSDTGTVDLEGEESSLENEENTHEEAITSTTEVVVGSGAAARQEEAVLNADGDPKRIENTATGEAQLSAEASEEDVSEAETEILEDDEPDTDDLGLDYSDDSDSGGSKPVDDKTNATGGQKDAAGSKKDGAISERETTNKRHGGSDSKQEASNDKKEDKASASAVGVQQFFDFVPLKLKPKAKTATSAAPKLLPVHNHTVTHSKMGNNDVGKTTAKSKKTPVVPTKPSIGSNGLRPSKKPIATTTTKKGKYLVTRRSTKMLDDSPETKRQPKRQYTMVPTKNSNSSGTKDLDDVPLAMLAKEISKKPDDKPTTRYLLYAGAKKTEDAPSYAAETPRIVPKSRFGGGGGLNSRFSTTQNSSAALNGHHLQVNDKNAPRGGYRREPQISIYDALHINGQENASDIREGTGFKRPSRFKKMQEEAARNGTPMVKSRLQDTDWDKVPIPKKKKKQASQVEKPAQDALLPPLNTSDHGSRNGAGKSQNKRRKKSCGSSNKSSGPSYYGPQASQLATSDKYDSLSRGRRAQESSNYRRDDDRWKKPTLSPLSRDRDRYDREGRFRDDRRRRGSSRSRSRSPSPRSRDYSSNRYRRRSRSRSWSRERSSEHDHRHPERTVSIDRDRDRETNGSRRSFSPENRDSGEPPELGEVYQNGKIGDTDRSAKKQKTSHYTEASPSPDALATFDDDGGNMFISDSDDDGKDLIKEVEDIRFDLESVPVDEALMTRQVYVTGVNPTVSAEQIEEDFARFGVGVDRETGFPAIDVFTCQRHYLGRGDARVTFKTDEGAQEAVEELNSKNVKNSMIRVRRMDVHTHRILTVQFQLVRDTWRCTRTQCRADVSVWNAKCDKCGRKRVYGPSNIKIGAESWLCSLCFTANEPFDTSCHGCMESLPEVDRSTFYTS